MKYNIGDKFIVEIDNILFDEDGNELYMLKGVYNTVFDEMELDDLEALK